jgi:hypothetical protein
VKQKIQATFMVAVLLTVSILTGCDWSKVDRRVTVAGFTLHLSTEAAALTAQAFKNRGRLNPDDYKALLAKLAGLTEAAQRVNIQFDQTTEMGPTNTDGALKAIKEFIAVADGILSDQLVIRIDLATLGQIRANLAAAVVVATGIQTALVTLQKPMPVGGLKIGKDTAERAFKTGSRAFTAEDAILAADVLNIGARFVAQLRLVSGADAAFVKAQRDAKYESLKKFYSDQQMLR